MFFFASSRNGIALSVFKHKNSRPPCIQYTHNLPERHPRNRPHPRQSRRNSTIRTISWYAPSRNNSSKPRFFTVAALLVTPDGALVEGVDLEPDLVHVHLFEHER